ncbi:DUF3618 domain-containing protein [Nocardioides sp. KC13]|uniref:DUF3618 domain-containing protein n=1 Tax=Nocardioides turkmenicus TaxID=2711220 RepID=A0A6M1QXS7_9ACTN|nr:DUF3618 domain-containing protein [Nocardioides sp. KC13]NGN94805.1 DUF3618 domain-containing protein [Nocardioides sp. KC13]
MTHNTTRPVEAGGHSLADVEADLDTTRHEMADTLDELAARLDVKTRGKEKAHEVKERTQMAARSRDVQIRGGIVAAIVVGAILMLVRRKRRLKTA